MSEKLLRKAEEGKMYPITLQFHEGPVTRVYINEDQTMLFSAGNDQRLNVHSLFTGEQLGQIDIRQAIKAFGVTRDSEYIIIAGFVGQIYIYRIDGTEVGTFELDMKIFALDLNQGDNKFVVGGEKFTQSNQKCVYVFDLNKVIDLLNKKHKIVEGTADHSNFFDGQQITQVVYSYLNKFIYVCTEGGYLNIYDSSLNHVDSKKIFNGIPINSITFSKKYDFMLVTSDNGAKILHPETFETITELRSDYPVYCAQFSPLMYDEKNPKYHVIMGGGARARDTAFMRQGGLEIYIMNAIHGNVLSRLGGHYGPINWIHVFPDGSGIVTAGEESIVRIYRFDKSYFTDPVFSHTNVSSQEQ